MKFDLSIIIPTHNSEKTIKNCLESIINQSYPKEKFEIIVVDDGSKDDSVKISKEFADKVIQVESCFQGKARNIGAQKAESENIAFIDSDCRAKKGWVENIIKNLKASQAITGPIENGNQHSDIACAEYFLEFGGWDKSKKKSPVRFMPGCNQGLKKSAFEKAGRFTEERESEDVLFGDALSKAKITPFFIPEIKIEHLCRTDKEKFLANMELLGKYSARSRKKVSSARYASLMTKRSLIPILFWGKIAKTAARSFSTGNGIKFLKVLPHIFAGTSAFCKGVKEEISNSRF
jgi:glycosyltransferase involved in cell wall biosynthesis